MTVSVPAPAQADALLAEAERLNPGAWTDHVRHVAAAARAIAQRVAFLDGDIAWSLGLLHDIGRREGPSGMRHITDGYRYLVGKGFPHAARICITHSFPTMDAALFQGNVDIGQDELKLVADILASPEADDYDRLIQLCDSLAVPEGIVLMETRLIDVAMRHGAQPFLPGKWKAYFEIKAYFDAAAGINIYALFDDVVRNTFGM